VIDAALRAAAQMFSPSFRAVLLKSMGLALLLIILMGASLDLVLSWGTQAAERWADGVLWPGAKPALELLGRILSFAAVLGVIVGSVFLMPSVTALVASLFVDEIAAEVERSHYSGEPVGRALPLPRALLEGVKTALLAGVVYLIALPFLLFAGFGVLMFFFATAFLLGREYFLLAAMRFHPPHEARLLRNSNEGKVFLAGMLIAAFVSIPIVNLAAPLFGMALMVHLHKRVLRTVS
jgi:uncharacterized protein involved in cysteine biosynthesis